MKQTIITYRNQNYKITALDNAAMGMLSRRFLFAQTDAQMYKIAKSHPNNLSIAKENS